MSFKKFLILCLALCMSLCMLSGIALADDDGDSAPDGTPWDDATRAHAEYLGEYRVVVEATCTEKGIGRYDCSFGDGHFHELFIPALGHEFDDEAWKVVKEPTCTEKGTEQNVCTRCGKTITRDIKALGHEWSSESQDVNWGRVIKEPTCQEEGLAEDYCLRCGEVNTFVKPRVIEKVDHSWMLNTDEMMWPTCLGNGEAYYVCEYCGEQLVDENGDTVYYEVTIEDIQNWFDYPEFDGHDWDNWVVAEQPTCFKEGSEVRWCKICGDKQEVTIDKLAAVYEPVQPSRLIDCYTEEVTYRCILCEGKEDADGNVAHPDYTETKDVVAHTFKHEKAYVVEDVKPTCEEEGYIAYKCVFEDSIAHTVGDRYEYDKVIIPALGHDWNGWVERVAPGAQDNEYGYWIRECKRCGKVEERISKYAPEHAGEHVWEVLEGEEATCTEGGWRYIRCTLCGLEKWEGIEPLGHDWDEGLELVPAACEVAGKTLFTCKICGDVELQRIPEALEHIAEEVPAVEPTCTEAGKTAGEVCKVCGKVLTAQEEIPALGGHKYEKTAAVAPTCTEAGKTEGVVCTVCGDEMLAPKEVPALGHKLVVVEGKAATCTEAGLTDGEKCEVCGTVTKAQEEIAALGHKYEVTEEVAATPTEKGKKVYTCSVCGDSYEEEVEFVPTADPAYNLKGVNYDGEYITGSVEHDASTKDSDQLYIRATYFFANGTTSIVVSVVNADGTFDIGLTGDVAHVTLAVTGTGRCVRPDGSWISMGVYEF